MYQCLLKAECDRLSSADSGSSKIQNVAFTSASGAELNDTATTNNHRNHRRFTLGALGAANQFCMAVRAKQIHNGVGRYFML